MDIPEVATAIQMGTVGMVAQPTALEAGGLTGGALAAALVVIKCLTSGLG